MTANFAVRKNLVYNESTCMVCRSCNQTTNSFHERFVRRGETQKEVDLVRKPTAMRIGVVLHHHNPQTDPPSHFISKTLAAAFLNERRGGDHSIQVTAIMVSKKLIWLKTSEPFQEIKRRHVVSRCAVRPIPKLLPPRRPESLDLSYPARGMETARHPHEAFRQACLLARLEQQRARA